MPSVKVKQETIEQKCNCKLSDCSTKRCGCVKNGSRCQRFCGCDGTLCKNQRHKTKIVGAKNQTGTLRDQPKLLSTRSKSMEIESETLKIKNEIDRSKKSPRAYRKLFSQRFDETVDLGLGDESQSGSKPNSNALATPKSPAKSKSLTTSKSDIRPFFEFFRNLTINEIEARTRKRQSPSLS